MIVEHDIVVLTRDLADEHLVAGDTGTVVLVHRGERPTRSSSRRLRAIRWRW